MIDPQRRMDSPGRDPAMVSIAGTDPQLTPGQRRVGIDEQVASRRFERRAGDVPATADPTC